MRRKDRLQGTLRYSDSEHFPVMQSPLNNTQKCSISNEHKEETPVSSNGKERRRTHCINMAFGELRKCIPNVPTDTKLSKIKTLRLAISYIQYLTEMLDAEEDDLYRARIIAYEIASKNDHNVIKRKKVVKSEKKEKKQDRKCRHSRTGWPQHVWALDLR
ncbi:heart- and neural crest derivatives-expressed protein 1 [Paramuricea clavata]|uniref:Heart- and neural crest derivatives-expressed protein 1 n=1 Tax=Paramuricea clavata TaxID=317549 RepID=A0A7D9HX54_PARCT|nr:heart- and neural crest derivatives-expressed protein 1 [Paramuricea clavata]